MHIVQNVVGVYAQSNYRSDLVMTKRRDEPTDQEQFNRNFSQAVKEKRLVVQHPNQLRNLPQYKKMTDEEFEHKYQELVLGVEFDKAWEERVQRRMLDFSKAYDLDDLKPNDMAILTNMINSMLRLEDYNKILTSTTKEGINLSNIAVVEKLGKLCEGLTSDISKMQDDLKITRKIRKNDREESVINYLEDLKVKAKKFYEQKMMYIFCPNCNTLLATIWTLYPEYKTNKINLVCHRLLDNGKYCNTIVNVDTAELLEKRGSNKIEIMPESIQ